MSRVLLPRHELPPVPTQRYFTADETAALCGIAPHVLRYWEQEFTQLSPKKRGGGRRYYQHHEVMLVRRIRALLLEEGMAVSAVRRRLLHADNPDHVRRPDYRLIRQELEGLLSFLDS